jgi:hypothetical protein
MVMPAGWDDVFRILTWKGFLARTGMTEAEFGGYLGADGADLAAGLPRSARHLHDGETVFVGIDRTGPWDDAGFPLELWGAHGQAGNGELAALSRRNGLHFFEQLELAPAPEGEVETRPPRLLMVVGAREAAQDALAGSFAALGEARARLRGWEVVGAIANFSESTVVASIVSGVDAVVFVAHGARPHAESATLWFGGDGRTSVSWGAVDAALRRNPRPLRFAFIMACELYAPVLATLRSLAAAQRLHPHFGAVLVRGSPDMAGGAVFAAALLDTLVRLGEHEIAHQGEDQALAAAAPLAFAVQEARRRVLDELARENPPRSRETIRIEATRARLVHARPDVRPFPVGRELEQERYLASLEAGLGGVVRHA